MSWLYSRALVEEYSAATSSAGARSALSSGSPTPQAFLPPDRTTAFSRPSRSGMTFRPLTDDLGAELLTWFLAASRARTSATADTSAELAARGPGCGRRWPELLARFDPNSFSWRTSQRCLVEGWEQYLETWPQWGLMRNGECWALEMSAPPRKTASASGSWPTLKAQDGEQYSKNLKYFERRRLIAPDLPVMVGLTTPPTPLGFYGRLNPAWCEWLMGWPIGWTALKPLATDRCPSAPLPHGECLEEVEA